MSLEPLSPSGTPDQREAIIAECKSMFNDICVLGETELVRLVGFHEGEDDYYYRVRGRLPNSEDRLSSCVGACISLRGIYPADRYEYMDRLFALNGAPKAGKFILSDPASYRAERLERLKDPAYAAEYLRSHAEFFSKSHRERFIESLKMALEAQELALKEEMEQDGIYTRPIPIHGDVMTVQEFRDAVESGSFIDYDGDGNPAKNGSMSPTRIYPSTVDRIPSDATHIVWFNR